MLMNKQRSAFCSPLPPNEVSLQDVIGFNQYRKKMFMSGQENNPFLSKERAELLRGKTTSTNS